jgi:hypothetical protein
LLDATREHLEKAPRVEGRNYERLYPAATAEPIFVSIGPWSGLPNLRQPCAKEKRLGSGARHANRRIAVSFFAGRVRIFGRDPRLSGFKIAFRSAML